MNKEYEYIKLSTTINKKFDDILRRHAYLLKININDTLELYQQAYLREQEREKAEKRAKREQEQQEKAKNTTEQNKNGGEQEKK